MSWTKYLKRRPADQGTDKALLLASLSDRSSIVAAVTIGETNPGDALEDEADILPIPDVSPVLKLHRHTDGYVDFAVKSDDVFAPVVGIRADALEATFPDFRNQFAKDAFVSINASFRLANREDRDKPYGHPRHNSNSLRYLCACYADLDLYKVGLNFYDAFAQVLLAQDSGVIPPASFIVRSGRGMWLLWLLEDPKNPQQAVPAYSEIVEFYGRVQRSILGRLSAFGADLAGTDAARHVRLPGSLHTGHTEGSGYVKWWCQGSAQGGFSYTLNELADFFQVERLKPRRNVDKISDGPREPKTQRWRGWLALHGSRLRDFETLWDIRGGFYRGTRNNATKIYAMLLRKARRDMNRNRLESELGRMATQCHPALAPSVVKATVRYVYQKGAMARRMRDQTMADWLQITPEESAMLERLPAASSYGLARESKFKSKRSNSLCAAPPTVADRQHRLRAIREVVANLKQVPTVREMAELHLPKRGIRVSYVSVWNDYKELTLKSAMRSTTLGDARN